MIITEKLRSPVSTLLSDEELPPDDEGFTPPIPGEDEGVGGVPADDGNDGAGFGLDDGIETPGKEDEGF